MANEIDPILDGRTYLDRIASILSEKNRTPKAEVGDLLVNAFSLYLQTSLDSLDSAFGNTDQDPRELFDSIAISLQIPSEELSDICNNFVREAMIEGFPDDTRRLLTDLRRKFERMGISEDNVRKVNSAIQDIETFKTEGS